jgi:mono/diheme cytochrome c family protein
MTIISAVVVGGALAAAATVGAQHAGHSMAKPEAAAAKPDAPAGSRRVTMEELHNSGGVPRGWTFALPGGGDPAKGRQLFADLECYKCHAISGGGFPPSGGDGKTGPELTGMGAHHPAEYFAESILAPNAVIVEGPGFVGPDGRSIMPSYADSLSVTQLVDLVAFIKSQDGGGTHAHHGGGGMTERTAGPYRIRLMFHAAGGGHDHGAHAHHASAPQSGHLMAFVSDTTTGESVPYLPVTANVQMKGAATKRVKLMPMLGGTGFHYGGDVALPSATQRIVLSIGPTTMRVVGADRARFARAQTVVFEWSASGQ